MKHVINRPRLGHLVLLLLLAALPCSAEDPCAAQDTAADAYTEGVLPYVQKYCVQCHGSKEPKGELDLARYTSAGDLTANFRRWNNIIEFIRDGEMPPEKAPQPEIDESNRVVANIEAILLAEARKHAGDPGVVLPRRLSNTEYDLSIRELTGVEIHPTKDFPVDPAGGEGFDNTGEALGMSPNLLKKYLAAAQLVSEHLVLKTDGISFAPYPVTSYNQRKKLTEQAIINFYQSREVDTLAYLEAAWRYRYRGDAQQGLSIQQWAVTRGLSARYLALVWTTLSDSPSQPGFLRELGKAWEAVPAPIDAANRPAELPALRDLIEFDRRVLAPPLQQLIRSNAGNWPISHLDFRARTAASRDRFDASTLKPEALLKVLRVSAPPAGNKAPQSYSAFLRIDPAFSDGRDYVLIKRPLFSLANQLPNNEADEEKQQVQSLRSVLEASHPELVEILGFGRHPEGGEIDSESFVVQAPAVIEIPLTVEMQGLLDGKHLLMPVQLDPEHSRDGSVFVRHSLGKPDPNKFAGGVEHLIYRDSVAASKLAGPAGVFCNAFPNRFFYVDSGRGLAAGFHLVEGFFRDDRPLVEKVLSDQENAELDGLWRELDFVTQSAETLLRGFVWFERSEREVLHDKRFDFLRPEDPLLVENSLLDKFEKLYLDKLGIKRLADTLEAESPSEKYDMIHGFFSQIRAGLQQRRELMQHAEQRALADLHTLARQAYRRPLRPRERESLQTLYQQLRGDGRTVEAAIRGMLAAVLMSPDFCYRYNEVPEGKGIYPITDHDLASRLSYFLWSSLPDDELLAAAEAGQLQDETQLVVQARRMLKDPRVSAFAREFFGQWLRFRDYLSKDPINAAAFPGYDEPLRAAMFEEPVRLASYLIQTDQPITELLNSDVTFVNRALAKHYGGELEKQYQQQSASSKDGQAWYPVSGLRQAGRGGLFGMAVILTKNSAGQRTSPVKRGFWSVHHLLGQHFPPPPANVPELPKSEKAATSTIRELLAAHVSADQCALCHKHFDSLGVAMEGFDAIGRLRTKDSAGRPIDNVAELPNGDSAKGIPGLIDYIEGHRRADFVRTMCRKFLGYALGRSVQLSDQPLLTEMETALEKNGYRFSVLFEVVIRSPQFRQQRGRDFVAASR